MSKKIPLLAIITSLASLLILVNSNPAQAKASKCVSIYQLKNTNFKVCESEWRWTRIDNCPKKQWATIQARILGRGKALWQQHRVSKLLCFTATNKLTVMSSPHRFLGYNHRLWASAYYTPCNLTITLHCRFNNWHWSKYKTVDHW